MFDLLADLYQQSPTGYHKRIFTGCKEGNQLYQDLLKWIESETPKLENPCYSFPTKVFWILTGLTDFPVCKCCNQSKGYTGKNVRSVGLGYFPYCSRSCMQHSSEVRDKKKATNLRNNGVEYPAQNPEIFKKVLDKKLEIYGNKWGDLQKQYQTCIDLYGHPIPYAFGTPEFKANMKAKHGVEHNMQDPEIRKKVGQKIFFNGVRFDSFPELAFYIWLSDHKIKFDYQPDCNIWFEFRGNQCRYLPDFRIGDQLYEVKGDHFFNSDGTMKFPFRGHLSKERIEFLSAKQEAKHQCMLANNVIILTSKDYQKYLDYVSEKYGKNYLKQFKRDAKS